MYVRLQRFHAHTDKPRDPWRIYEYTRATLGHAQVQQLEVKYMTADKVAAHSFD